MEELRIGKSLRQLTTLELLELETACEHTVRQQRADFDDYETLFHVRQELERRNRTVSWYQVRKSGTAALMYR